MISKSVPYLGLEWEIRMRRSLDGEDLEVDVVVKKVIPNSPASKSDIRVDDVIHSVDGSAVTMHDTLNRLIKAKKPGSVAMLIVARGGKKLNIRVTLGERQIPLNRYHPPETMKAEG